MECLMMQHARKPPIRWVLAETHSFKNKSATIKTADLFLGGMWGSNPRHSEPQSDALPTELRPPCRLSALPKNQQILVNPGRSISAHFRKAGAKVLLFYETTKFFIQKNDKTLKKERKREVWGLGERLLRGLKEHRF